MDKKKQPNTMPSDAFDTHVISATECTGLMPTLPQTDEDAESYANLYNIHVSGSEKDNSKVPYNLNP